MNTEDELIREILFHGFHKHEDGAETICVEGEIVNGRWIEGFTTGVWSEHLKHPSNYDSIQQEYDKLAVLLDALKTRKEGPRCSAQLYLADLPDYDYVCPSCDENFMEFEVK